MDFFTFISKCVGLTLVNMWSNRGEVTLILPLSLYCKHCNVIMQLWEKQKDWRERKGRVKNKISSVRAKYLNVFHLQNVI